MRICFVTTLGTRSIRQFISKRWAKGIGYKGYDLDLNTGTRNDPCGALRHAELIGIGVAFLLEWLYGKRPVP